MERLTITNMKKTQFTWMLSALQKTAISCLLFSILTGCEFTDEEEYRIAPDLDSLVNEFFIEALKRGVSLEKYNLVVCFDEIKEKDHLVGGVYTIKGFQRVVRINTRYKHSTLLKYILFHELGHALLNRKHTDNPSSIMNPVLYKAGLTEAMIDELMIK